MYETVDDWSISGTGYASGCLFLTRNSKFRVSVYNEAILHFLITRTQSVVQKETNDSRLLLRIKRHSNGFLIDW
jgi:hypothetical protein